MKQLIQDFKSGQIKLVDVPPPALAPGCVRVRNAFSLVSAGTERATVNLAQQSLVGKARSRPDLVKRVVETVKREGLSAAMRSTKRAWTTWVLAIKMASAIEMPALLPRLRDRVKTPVPSGRSDGSRVAKATMVIGVKTKPVPSPWMKPVEATSKLFICNEKWLIPK